MQQLDIADKNSVGAGNGGWLTRSDDCANLRGAFLWSDVAGSLKFLNEFHTIIIRVWTNKGSVSISQSELSGNTWATSNRDNWESWALGSD